MRYVSTRDNSKEYSFEDVFIKGLADDGGLYVPKSLNKYNSPLKPIAYGITITGSINKE